MSFNQTLSHIQKQFQAHYDVSSTIRHKGEKGKQRENGLLVLLREHLPQAYGVATGEIIPYRGATSSPQCDIIIYDHLRFPIIGRFEPIQLVPLEAVYAVIEVKSILTAGALKDAHNKFTRILDMPRCKSKSAVRKGMVRKPTFAIFAYKMKSTVTFVHEFLATNSFDCIVTALDHGLNITLDSGKGLRHIWMNTTQPDRERYQTLAFFYWAMLECMSQIDLGVPNFTQLITEFSD